MTMDTQPLTNTEYALLISPLVTALVLFFASWAKDEWTSYRNRQNRKD